MTHRAPAKLALVTHVRGRSRTVALARLLVSGTVVRRSLGGAIPPLLRAAVVVLVVDWAAALAAGQPPPAPGGPPAAEPCVPCDTVAGGGGEGLGDDGWHPYPDDLDVRRVVTRPHRLVIHFQLPHGLDPRHTRMRLVLARDGDGLVCTDLPLGQSRQRGEGRRRLRRLPSGHWLLRVSVPMEPPVPGAMALTLGVGRDCLRGIVVVPPAGGRLLP